MSAGRSTASGLLCGTVSRAQAPSAAEDAPEKTTKDVPATFSTKVSLVQVPVVVRDAKGKAVDALQKEDFLLFDKGKPQAITWFSVEKAGEVVIPAEVSGYAAAIEQYQQQPAIAEDGVLEELADATSDSYFTTITV
jgi:hypothetical protein